MALELRRSVLVAILATLLLGLVYPLLITGIGQLAFSSQANGSLVSADGRTVGSTLIGQGFSSPRYFLERPSATTPAYNASATGGSNLGPNSASLEKTVRQRIRAVLRMERPYNPGLTARQIPVDAVTASFSGIDPQISPAYAQLQARRVAAQRHLPLATVQHLISQNTQGPWLGLFGASGVNVLSLNLALDRISR